MANLRDTIVKNNIAVMFSPGVELEDRIANVEPGIMDLVESGDLSILNGIATTITTSHKDILTAFLDVGGTPQPLTYHPASSHVFSFWGGGKTDKDGAWKSFEEFFGKSGKRPIIVRKNIYEHMGRGVSVHEGTRENVQSSSDCLVQPFLYPPFSDGFMRDMRVIVMGGDASNVYTRRAMKPLLRDGSLIEALPSNERYMTNLAQKGVIEPAMKEYAKACCEVALKAVETVKRGARNVSAVYHENSKLPFLEKDPQFEWGSVDFLFDESGYPKVCEVDTSPNVIPYMKSNPSFVSSVAKYLIKKSCGKPVGVIGKNEVSDMVYSQLCKENVVAHYVIPKSQIG